MRNVGISVQARLKNISRDTGIDMPSLLRRYVQERLLYRLSVSSEAPNFVLKGGLLLAAYNGGDLLRPTEDIDFNGFDANGSVEILKAALETVLAASVEDDGVNFDIGTMRVSKDRTGIVPGGKIAVIATVGTARVELKVDVGFGNPVTPDTRIIEFPTILDGITPRPIMNAYPLETVIAEKLHAMAQFGASNTRIKDYYDIWMLSKLHEFEMDVMADAIETTFAHQNRPLPEKLGGLQPEFAKEQMRQWKAFLYKLPGKPTHDFVSVVDEVAFFVSPAIDGARSGTRNGETWHPMAGWSARCGMEMNA